ncbi:AbrB/MazE/SpoVT family DNA-binding domain-containing protein [Candidatus Bathyarchaeota archaeon]|nr:AbrB/MazE/SpoVT family DNA-binding domain-containing protein [Candidatus Bathyarchaeota archaeon]
MSYTVTSKGTVTIPAEVRRKYGIRKGSKVEFIETEEGILIVPIPRFEELFGVDREYRDRILQMVRDLEKERREEAAHEKSEL